MGHRLGEILVQQGVLTSAQVAQIVKHQRSTHRPFGALAEEMFGIEPERVEEAWATQYAMAATWIDPSKEEFCDAVRTTITNRQAWQFRVLPVRFDGSELMIATSPRELVRAVRFVSRCLAEACYLVLCEDAALSAALAKRHPMAGLTGGAFVTDRASLWREHPSWPAARTPSP